MEPQFWHERWENQQLGFHQQQVNHFLKQHWPELNLSAGSVFVPLCGKSVDMCYLAELGHQVVGSEFSEIAVRQFFAENGLTPTIVAGELVSRYQQDNYQLLLGDFFALSADDVRDCVAFYDRASMVALPEEMRQRYARQLADILPSGCCGLVILLEYPQALLAGPAFSVSQAWLTAHMGEHFTIEQLASYDVLQENQKFVKNGVPWLQENVYRITRK
ncbi:thiopurine S-methyltransferase [Shewanella mangrovi]|uniref:Thiopurine S-methyltransferase n=1 Tax=Shewanella mangrovi TaxID=1515746 RepID=A0A094JI86_9GAMM|nr:thiopurine S-methyltransferase [Shewanella mangrovi]KFZ38882.1 thiopurine S-methyltransferase [Shewanella mangrovi]